MKETLVFRNSKPNQRFPSCSDLPRSIFSPFTFLEAPSRISKLCVADQQNLHLRSANFARVRVAKFATVTLRVAHESPSASALF